MDEAKHDVLAFRGFPVQHRAKISSTDALDKRRVERMAFFPVALPRHATLLPFGTRARLRLGCSDQALTKRVYAFSACSTKARSFSRSSLML